MNLFSYNMTGIELQDHFIELVEIKKQRKTLILEGFSRKSIPDGVIQNGEIKDKDALGSLLLEAFRNANPKPLSTKQVSVILPTRLVFAHIFKLPAKLSMQELRQTMGYEAENTIPFQLSELYCDHRILEREDPKKPDAAQYVLFAAIPKRAANEYAQVFETLGIQVQMFGIALDAIMQVLHRQLAADHENIVLEFGTLATTALFLKGTALKAFTSSNDGYEKFVFGLKNKYGIDDATFRHKWENNMLDDNEIQELKTFIEKHYELVNLAMQTTVKPNIKPTDLHLSGEYAVLPIFYELAKKHFPALKIHIGDPKGNLLVDDKKFSKKQLEQGGKIPLAVYFSNSIGIAMAALKMAKISPLNLLPDRLKMRTRRKQWNLFATVTAVIISLLSLVIGGLLFAHHQTLNFARINLESDRRQIQNILYGTRYQEIQSLFTAFDIELKALNRVEAALFSAPKVLAMLFTKAPAEVVVTGSSFNDKSLVIQITGIANTREALLEYQQNLKELEYVSEVSLPLSSFNEKTQITFLMTVNLQFSKLPNYGKNAN